MKQLFKIIQLQDIEKNRLYDIHPFLDDRQLNNDIARSIQIVGIITPPIVIEKSEGKYETICGHQRIRCIKSLNIKSCYCQVLHKQCPAETILNIILEDQFAKGPLTTIEQACFIKICKQLLPDKNRQNSFFQSLLTDRITKGIHYLAPLAELEQSIQSAIHHGLMSEKIITDILHFSPTDQKILLSFFQSLNLGGNNQKKLIIQIRDILGRNKIALKAFIERSDIQEIVLNDQLDRSEKATILLEYIRRLHQPLLSSARDSFEQQIKALKLPDNITIIPAGSFEKDDVMLSVRFHSLEAFKKKWEFLKEYLSD